MMEVRKSIAYTAIGLMLGAVSTTEFTGTVRHDVDLTLVPLPVKVDPAIAACREFIYDMVFHPDLSMDAVTASGWDTRELHKDENGRAMVDGEFDIGSIKFTGTCFIEESEIYESHTGRK
jgi:hypothetical protein